jgi:hypothetical protein
VAGLSKSQIRGSKRGFGLAALASLSACLNNPDSASLDRASREVPAVIAAAEIIGRDARDVVDLLGPPGFVRRDGPAEIWQYRAGDCVFDLFIYREREVPRVTYIESRRRSGELVGGERCQLRVVSMVRSS